VHTVGLHYLKTYDFTTHYKGYQILGNINDAFISTVQCNTHT